MRCVTNLFRSHFVAGFLALGVALGTVSTVARAADELVTLTLPQTRALAGQAVAQGDTKLALRLAAGLLRANPSDPFAHYVVALANTQMGRAGIARRSAARAYRFAEPGRDRLRAAELAARTSYAEGRPSLAQFWLRRVALHTETEAEDAQIARDYNALRRINPFSVSLRLGLRDSNNVNNGSDSAINLINGQPDLGGIPAQAQALPGMIGTADLSATYRLRANANSATTLSARYYLQRVRLSSEAKAKAPAARDSDYGSTYAEVALHHGFAVGPAGKGGTAGFQIAYGESWYAEQRSYRFARIGADRGWRLASGAVLRVNAGVERRYDTRYLQNDAVSLSLGASLRKKLARGDTISLSVALRDNDAKAINGTYPSVSLRFSYGLAKKLGPARVSAALGVGTSDYPLYIASRFIPATERNDTSVFGNLTFVFEDYDYAGFAPTLQVIASRRKSNFSFFSNNDFSVSLGFQSKF